MPYQVKLLFGDCLDVIKTLETNSIDSIVTDPPYGLNFMGQKWDYQIPSTDVWRECLRVLKPGGHILCFAGSRTQHRMICNLEDAGFEIRDLIMWVYASGFPKSLNISKALDKRAGVQGEVIGSQENWGVSKKEEGKLAFGDYAGSWNIHAPATEDAK